VRRNTRTTSISFPGSDFGKFANKFLQPAVDPSNIGRTVNLHFDDSRLKLREFTADDYIEAYDNAVHPLYTNVTELGVEFKSFVQELWDSGVTKTVDEDGRVILYGTNLGDTLDAAKVLGELGFFDPLKKHYDASNKGVAIIGGKGNDTLIGGIGEDKIVGGVGHDTINGGARGDKLYGGQGIDTIFGGDGDDLIEGGADNDILHGEAGLDDIVGGAGDDVLIGGEDSDTLEGGTGFDEYRFSSSDFAFGGADTIIDSDGIGHITVNGQQHRGGVHIKDTDYYQSRDGAHIYQWSGGNLVIDNTIIVSGFRNHDLGIYLEREKEREDSTGPITASYGQALLTTSPLVLDLNGDGVTTVGRNKGAYFDFDGTGKRTLTGWVAPSDGLLVFDRNHNGVIDNGSELFGNNDRLPSSNGFEALSHIDSNKDGKISSTDQQWSELQVWRDLNRDGYTNTGELISLADAGVEHINLNYDEYFGMDDYGNLLLQFGSYRTTSGKTWEVTDVWFQVDTATVLVTEVDPITAEVAMLPDVFGMGNSEDLRRAVMHDETGELRAAVDKFANEKNNGTRDMLLDSILEIWAGATEVVDGSRGPYFSAKKVAILEAFMGRDYYQEDSYYPTNPGLYAIPAVQKAYANLHDYYYSAISAQTFLKPYYDQITYSRDAISNELVANLLPAGHALKAALVSDPDGGLLLADFVRTLKGAPPVSKLDLVSFEELFSDQSLKIQRVLSTALSGFAVTDGMDVMTGGDANDVMVGFDGDDILSGRGGNDVIEGGVGNDTIDAGTGADIIYFGRGDGMDSVLSLDYDSSAQGKNNSDTLRLLENISASDVTLTLKQNEFLPSQTDLVVIINEGSDGMILHNWPQVDNNRVERIEFSDGTIWDLQAILDQVSRPTEGDDILRGSNEEDSISGLGGNDLLYGGDGDDMLNGDDGHDVLLGERGNDILTGGAGNDDLQGGAGSDTFIYNHGDGSDIIRVDDYEYGIESESFDDVLRFGTGIGVDDIVLSRDRDSLYLSIEGGSDYITLQDWNVSWARVARVEFDDGTVWDADYLAANSNHASDRNDYIEGTAEADILEGRAGNDILVGLEGDDVFDGGSGDDELRGGEGRDTYLFGNGDGHDTIYGDSWPETILGDTIQFKAGVVAEDVQIRREDSDLVITIGNDYSDSLRVNAWFGDVFGPSNPEQVDKLVFADGTVWDYDTIYSLATAPGEGDDYVEGTQGDDLLHGYGGSDQIIGQDGDDLLNGGLGDDYLVGGLDSDTYVFSLWDGNDFISDWDDTPGSKDVIRFGDGILPEDIVLTQGPWDTWETFYLKNVNSGDSVLIEYWNQPEYTIESVEFADGTVWDLPAMVIGVAISPVV